MLWHVSALRKSISQDNVIKLKQERKRAPKTRKHKQLLYLGKAHDKSLRLPNDLT